MAEMKLTKVAQGARVSLTKQAGGEKVKRVLIGLGWDPEKSIFGPTWDLDASVICIDSEGRKEDLIYFRNKRHSSGAIIHNGDNLTGAGEGDDETIDIDLDRLPERVVRLSFVVNIYDAYSKRQDFSKVKRCFVRVENSDSKRELVRYEISGNSAYNGKTGMFIADLYRHNGEWKFNAIGEGVNVADVHEMVAMKCNR